MADGFSEINDEDMEKVCLVTIVDVISTTSIPVNEFVLYRNKIRPAYKQIVFTRKQENRGNVVIPEGVEVINIDKSMMGFRRQIKEVVDQVNREEMPLVFHLHHQISALHFFRATLFMRLRQKTVFTIHSFYSDRDTKYKISSCLCAVLANFVNCVSIAAYKDYPKWVRAIKGKRMGAILNGIDCKRIERALESEGKHCDVMDMKRLVCVDRIIPIKNQKFIVGLLKHLPETRLTMVGMEDENHAIKKQAEREGVADRVEFTGLLPREEVYRTINKCGLYVTASIVEGLHLSVLEAMRVGAIPLISDIPAHREIAANSENLFKPLPLEEELWVKKINEYQSMDKTSIEQLSHHLASTAEEYFSLEKMHNEYDAVYNKILKQTC